MLGKREPAAAAAARESIIANGPGVCAIRLDSSAAATAHARLVRLTSPHIHMKPHAGARGRRREGWRRAGARRRMCRRRRTASRPSCSQVSQSGSRSDRQGVCVCLLACLRALWIGGGVDSIRFDSIDRTINWLTATDTTNVMIPPLPALQTRSRARSGRARWTGPRCCSRSSTCPCSTTSWSSSSPRACRRCVEGGIDGSIGSRV